MVKRLKRLPSLVIAFAMFSMFAPILYGFLYYVFPYFASVEPFRFWPIILFGAPIMPLPFLAGFYFMAFAFGQKSNPKEWISYLPKTYLLLLYFVGVFFILENSFLLLFPEGDLDIQFFLYAVAGFIVAFTPRLIKHVKKKLFGTEPEGGMLK